MEKADLPRISNRNLNKSTTKGICPAERARVEAGFTLEQAAKKMRLTSRYLRQIERNGNASVKTARRLAQLYKCSGDLFLFPPKYFEGSGQRAIQPSKASLTAGVNTVQNASASRRHRSMKKPELLLMRGSGTARRLANRMVKKSSLVLVSVADEKQKIQTEPKRLRHVSTHWAARQRNEDAQVQAALQNSDGELRTMASKE